MDDEPEDHGLDQLSLLLSALAVAPFALWAWWAVRASYPGHVGGVALGVGVLFTGAGALVLSALFAIASLVAVSSAEGKPGPQRQRDVVRAFDMLWIPASIAIAMVVTMGGC